MSAEEEEKQQNLTAEQIMENNKDDAEEYKKQGNQQFKSQNYEQALELYDKAIELYPKEISYYLNKVAVYIQKQDLNLALETCEKASEIRYKYKIWDFQKIAKLEFRFGSIYENMGELGTAITHYERSLQEVTNQEVKYAVTRCLLQLKLNEQNAYGPFQTLQNIIYKSIIVNLGTSYFLMIFLYYILNGTYIDYSKGEEAFQRSKEAFQAQDFKNAKLEIEEAIKRNPYSVEYVQYLGEIHFQKQNYQESINAFESAIQLNSENGESYMGLGRCYNKMGLYYKQLQSYERCLEEDPGYEQALQGLKMMHNFAQNSKGLVVNSERVMNDPFIQDLIASKEVQQYLQVIESNPTEAKKITTKNEKLREKLVYLVLAGIIQCQL